MKHVARIGAVIGAVLSVASQVSRWAKEHPDEAAAAKERAKRIAADVQQRQDLRGPRLLITARRDATLVRNALKKTADVFDEPALQHLRDDYIRLINRIRVTRRIGDRTVRETQYDLLEQQLAEMRFRSLEVFGYVQRQLPETD